MPSSPSTELASPSRKRLCMRFRLPARTFSASRSCRHRMIHSPFSLKKMRLSSQHSPECRSCFRGPEMTSMDCSCLMRSDASSPMAAVIRILISHPSLPIRPEPFRLSRMMERCPHLSGLSMTAAVPFYSRYPDISSGFLVSKYVMCCNAYLAAKMSGHS